MDASAAPPVSPFVRVLERADLADLAELRFRALVEETTTGPRAPLVDGVRERVAASTQLLFDNDKVLVLVAIDVAAPVGDDGGRPLLGFALGRAAVWPPIWRTRRIGEITSLFVVPSHRRAGVLEALVTRLSSDLARGGAETIRSTISWGDPETRARFEAMGFTPMSRMLSKPPEAT